MKIYTDHNMIEQYRFPRSKGKRIKRKFRKDLRNYRPMKSAIYNVATGSLVCHPAVYDYIKNNTARKVANNNTLWRAYGSYEYN